jgi:SAM-dependent methyltransferase
VTGVDFSPVAVAGARALAEEVGLGARFVEADVLALPEELEGDFDIVLTYYGTVTWLPDARRWGEVIARCLRPGGFFYFADTHPAAMMLEVCQGAEAPRLHYPYFQDGPQRFETPSGTYAAPGVSREHGVTYEWQHTVQDLVCALIDAGLRLDYVHEFPYTFYNCWWWVPGLMREDARGFWHLAGRERSLPLMLSVKATRPG